MRISDETKIGILAAIAITLLILGYNFMKGENLFTSTNTYYATYKEVDNLFTSNPVVINGYKVGHVSSVEMDMSSKEHKLIVGVKVPDDIDVPKNSILKIINSDLVGSKAIEIILGDDSVGFAIHGDTLAADQDPSIEAAVSSVLEPITVNVNRVLKNIDSAVSGADLESTLVDLSEALSSFKKTSSSLKSLTDRNAENIDRIIANIRGISAELNGAGPRISSIVATLDSTAEAIAALDYSQLATSLNGAITEFQETLTAIQDGQGSLGRLANDDELFNNLNNAAKSLDSLAKDIQRYPDRYIVIKEKNRAKANKRKEETEKVNVPGEW